MANYIDRIRYKSRKNKFDQFIQLVKPTPNDTVLEVGITNREYSPVANFLVKHYPYRNRITALGLGDISEFEDEYPDINTVSYDGKIMPFEDKQFDIAHSNAVIEHVGSLERQSFFMKDIIRVSKRGMITTPNKFFPLEIHTKIPFLHWMKKEKFDNFLCWIGKEWASEKYMYLLCVKDLEILAKRANMKRYRVIRNRFLGMTVTFSLIWFDE